MYRVLLLGDHAWRDVPALAAIKYHLKQRDIDAWVVDIHLFQQAVDLLHPHVVVINHMHDKDRNRIVDMVRRRGGLSVIMPTEGRPNTNALIEWAVNGFPRELCDLYLCWTDEIALRFPADFNVRVVGAPRLDFYYPPLSKLIRPKIETCTLLGLNPNRPILTVAGSWPNAKFADYSSDFMVKDWEKLGMTTIKRFENPLEFAKAEKARFERFRAWLALVSTELPDWQIVVKPHPAENIYDWLQYCDRIGAKVMLTDYIFNLLEISDLHVGQVDCMTLPEAWCYGKPTLGVKLHDELDGPTLDAMLCTFWVTRPEEFVNNLKAIAPLDNTWKEVRSNYIHKWLSPNNNVYPNMTFGCHAVAEEIGDMLTNKKPTAWKEPTREDYANLHKLLMEHSKQNAEPKADWIGQYSKAVRLEVTQEWERKIEEVYNEHEVVEPY